MAEFLRHNRIRLALHTLRAQSGPALLLLHGLGECAPHVTPVELAAWPGPVYALDFTGHGQSTVPKGGGYTCETLLADANTALGHLGKATVMGRGLGAYVALLVAGGRPERARGAILQDGPGLTGGDSGSTPSFVRFADPGKSAPPDPVAIVELATDVRLPEYAAIFARLAVQYSGLPTPISICALERPAWLSAIAAEPGVEVVPLPTALARYARENA